MVDLSSALDQPMSVPGETGRGRAAVPEEHHESVKKSISLEESWQAQPGRKARATLHVYKGKPRPETR